MEEKKKSVKKRIIDSAWRLFYEKGYNGTTVDDIIELSGTSKGSFYYYFKTKDELLYTLSIILDDQYEELEQSLTEDQNRFDQLMYINYMAHEMMEQKISRELITSLYSTQLTSMGERHLLDKNRRYFRLVMQIVDEGQRRGELTTDMSVLAITEYYSMCERSLIYDWCLNRGSYSLTEKSRELLPIMMEHFRVKVN